jgi:hypothetical protein
MVLLLQAARVVMELPVQSLVLVQLMLVAVAVVSPNKMDQVEQVAQVAAVLEVAPMDQTQQVVLI